MKRIFKNRVPVKSRIAQVLMENQNGFLSTERIAEIAYGDAYMHETYNNFNGLVKRNMQHAIAHLTENGYVVIKDLELCENSKTMTYKSINGYKIADKEDIVDVEKNLITKDERIENAKQLRLVFTSLVEENGLTRDKLTE